MELPPPQVAAWEALTVIVTFVAVEDQLIGAASRLAVDFYLPSDHAWPLAAAITAQCERMISASEELLISAQMLGLRVSLVRGE